MNKSEEFFKKDTLIKKYANKPFPKFLIYMGNIKKFDEYENWIKDQTRVMLKWIGSYLIILPFFISFFIFCLSALGVYLLPPLKVLLLAVGFSIGWYLLLSLIKDIRGAIKNE